MRPSLACFAAVLTMSAARAGACPMCRDGAVVAPTTRPAAADAAGLDFNGSIYAMAAVLGVVGLGVGRAMVRAVRG